jgi:MFS family permease
MADQPVAPIVDSAEKRKKLNLTILMFGIAILQGFALNLMPVMFPTMGEKFSISKAQQGLLQTNFALGAIIALIVAGYCVNLFGAKKSAWVILGVLGSGAFLFGAAPIYPLVLLAAVLIGMGTATFVAVYAAIITAEFAEKSQRMYMLTYAVLAGSATIATMFVGWLIKQFDYTSVFMIFGVCIWGLSVVLMTTFGRSLKADVGCLHHDPAHPKACDVERKNWLQKFGSFLGTGILNRGSLYLLGAVVLLDTLASGNLLAWMPTYFKNNFHMENTGVVLSCSSGGVLAGRLLMGAFPPGFIGDRVLLAICYTGAMVAAGLILLIHPSVYVAFFLVGLSGAFVAAQAPTTYSIATSKFGERAPAAIPLVDGIGNFGGLIGPPLLGAIADITGDLNATMWLVPICGFSLVILLVIWEAADRIGLRRAKAQA